MTTETTTTPAAEATQSQAPSSEAAATATAAEGAAAAAPATDPFASLLESGGDQAGDDGKGQDGDAEKPAEEKPAGAPDKYEFQAPEGDSFDPKVLGEFEAVARELNMPQESAQKILDKIAPALKAKHEEGLKAEVQRWAEASGADKEIGGDKLTKSIALADMAMKKLGTPALRELFVGSSLIKHPEVLRMLTRAGAAISDDAVLTHGNSGSSSRPMSAADLYPNSKLN